MWFTEGALSRHAQGPVFLQEPASWVEFSNSSGAVLKCSAHGNPPPDIRWTDAADKEVSHIPRLRWASYSLALTIVQPLSVQRSKELSFS